MINSNDFDRGYQDGLDDASGKVTKAKSYLKSGFSIKFAILGDNALNTYIDGYDKGYEHGLLKKNDILNFKNKSINKMARGTNINYQIELLESLKGYLNGFQERLESVADNYEKKVTQLHEGGGLIDQIYEEFVADYLEVTKNKIKTLIDQINEEDIPFVEKQIDWLESR